MHEETLRVSVPGQRSFFAGHLAAWARRLEEKRIRTFATRSVYSAVSIAGRDSYEKYCYDLLIRGLCAQIVKLYVPANCNTDSAEMLETHSIDVVVLTVEEYTRLQDDLRHAAQVIEKLSR